MKIISSKTVQMFTNINCQLNFCRFYVTRVLASSQQRDAKCGSRGVRVPAGKCTLVSSWCCKELKGPWDSEYQSQRCAAQKSGVFNTHVDWKPIKFLPSCFPSVVCLRQYFHSNESILFKKKNHHFSINTYNKRGFWPVLLSTLIK